MRRALVVEDDPDIVELLAHYLKGEGFQVDALDNGREALERIRAETYQLLVLDLQLPGMDGLALCAEVRRDKRTRDVPVVMLTARGDESDRIVGLEMGADDYVVKPFSRRSWWPGPRALPPDRTRTSRPPGAFEVDRSCHTVRWRPCSI
jgi:DNA-binding response OmpR family regulator